MTSLPEIAEDTLAHVLPQPGVDRIDRGDLVLSSTGNSANVVRIGLGEQLIELGLVPDDEEESLPAMTLDTPPPAAPDVDVRRIGTLDAQLEALTVDWDVWGYDEAERARRAETERRRFDPAHGILQLFMDPHV